MVQGFAASRRGFLTGATALAAFTPLFVWAQETGTPEPGAQEMTGSASIPAGRNLTQHLTITVSINGRPYNFVVDTGAEQTVIADNVAAELGLAPGRPVRVEGLTGDIATYLVTADELSFGPFHFGDLSLPVLPRGFLQADGFLGLDVLNGSRVIFNFRDRLLTVERGQTRFAVGGDRRNNTTLVRMTGRRGRLKADSCSVDGVAAKAFIDTGAEVSVGNPALEAALRKRRRGVTSLGPVVLSGITGGQIQGQMIAIREIALQELRFTSGGLAIADVPSFDTWNLENAPALLIGMDFLRQFASVAIDYRSKEIRFELAQMQDPAPIRIANA